MIAVMKTSVIFGAGASLANALHFRGQRMQTRRPPLDGSFFDVMQGLNIPFTPALRSYYRRLTRVDPHPARVRMLRMEEFFKDLYFDFLESPDNESLRRAYIDLVEIYWRVLIETTNWLCAEGRSGAPIGRLLASVADASNKVTVITFNHDLVIEGEIFRRKRLAARWCLDHGYGALGQTLTPVYAQRTDDSLFRLHAEGGCDHSRAITVLKLHGSLNWMVRLNGKRPTARTLSGQSGQRSIQLLTSRLAQDRVRYLRDGASPGRLTWRLWPVIIPPVYAKQALRQTLRPSWDDAQRALENSERVIFFGYSLPMIDIDAEKLFERSLARNRSLSWIDVIDPAPAAAQRYAALAPALPVRWYPSADAFANINAF